MNAGEVWAYREKAFTEGWPVIPVMILQLGPERPGPGRKARVCYVEGEYQGLDMWVPMVRLRVPWNEVDAWLEDERRLAAARDASLEALDTVEHRAAWKVLYAYPRPDGILLGLDRREGPIVEIEDLDAVAEDLGLDADELRAEPLAFVDRFGTYIAPWPVAFRLARRVAEVYANEVLRSIAKDEAEKREEAINGYVCRFRDGTGWEVSPERCAERLDTIEAPAFALARQWCGADSIDRYDELQALRDEVRRLRGLVRHAISALEKADRTVIARSIRQQLGVAAIDPS